MVYNKCEKNKELQGLRGYAFLLVFFSHCKILLDENGLNRCSWFGACGVIIFLYLSGYLLIYKGKINILNNPNSIKSTVAKKLSKIYPLHILTFLLSIPLIYNDLLINKVEVFKIFFNITMLHCYIPKSSFYFSYNAVSWYLGLYLLCIIMSPIIRKFWLIIDGLTFRYLISVLCSLWIIEFIIWFFCRNYSFSHWLIYIFPFIRIIDFVLGGGMFVLQNKIFHINSYKKKNGLIFFIISNVWLSVMLYFSLYSYDDFFSIVAWMLPVGILFISFKSAIESSKLLKFLYTNKLIVTIGNLSLELFLFHQLVIRYIDLFLKNKLTQWALRYSIALVITLIIAYAYNKILNKVNLR